MDLLFDLREMIGPIEGESMAARIFFYDAAGAEYAPEATFVEVEKLDENKQYVQQGEWLKPGSKDEHGELWCEYAPLKGIKGDSYRVTPVQVGEHATTVVVGSAAILDMGAVPIAPPVGTPPIEGQKHKSWIIRYRRQPCVPLPPVLPPPVVPPPVVPPPVVPPPVVPPPVVPPPVVPPPVEPPTTPTIAELQARIALLEATLKTVWTELVNVAVMIGAAFEEPGTAHPRGEYKQPE